MPARTLTHKQQTVLDFIRRYFDANRRSPLIREIQAGCQILSYKSALDRLNALERKGLIRRLSNKHRGIRLIRKALAPPIASMTSSAAAPAASSNTGEGIPA